MNLIQLLQPEAVKVISASSSKKRLFHDIAELGDVAYGIDAEKAVEALLDRESLGPTGVGHGVALPHARLSGIDCVAGCFIRLEKPLDFGSADRQPVDLVFALFAPETAGVEHLKALAAVSRNMRDANFCTKLRANGDASTLFAILTESQSSQAA